MALPELDTAPFETSIVSFGEKKLKKIHDITELVILKIEDLFEEEKQGEFIASRRQILSTVLSEIATQQSDIRYWIECILAAAIEPINWQQSDFGYGSLAKSVDKHFRDSIMYDLRMMKLFIGRSLEQGKDYGAFKESGLLRLISPEGQGLSEEMRQKLLNPYQSKEEKLDKKAKVM